MSPQARYRRNLAMALSGTVVVGLVVAVTALWSLRSVSGARDDAVFRGVAELTRVERLRNAHQDGVAARRAYYLSRDSDYLDALASADAELDALLAGSMAAAHSPAERAALDALHQAQSDYVRAAGGVIAAAQEGDAHVARLWAKDAQPPQLVLRDHLDALVRRREDRLNAIGAEVRDAAHTIEWLLIGVAAAALLLTIGFAWMVVRLVTRAFERSELEYRGRTFQFLEQLPVGVFIARGDGTPYYANKEAIKLLGKGADPSVRPEDLAERYEVFVAGTSELYPAERVPINCALRGETVVVNDLEIRRNQTVVALQVQAAPICEADGTVAYAVAAFQDIRDLKHLALRDQLTGLANRTALLEGYRRVRSLCERRQRPITVAIVDFDHFKKINDEHGHGVGDEVLQRSAHVMVAAMRETDQLGRWGGEEFVVILPDTSLDGALVALEKLRRLVAAECYEASGKAFHATFSAGVVEVESGASLEATVQRADAPLYRAKREGRNRVLPA